MRTTSLILLLASLYATGCGDEGSITSEDVPKIEVSEGARSIARLSTIVISEQRPALIRIANTGSAPLEIRGIEVDSRPQGAFVSSMNPAPTRDAPLIIEPLAAAFEFSISFEPPGLPSTTADATVIITTNKTIDGSAPFTFELAPGEARPRLLVQPAAVDFGSVTANLAETEPITLLNTGTADLELEGFRLNGSASYEFAMLGQVWRASPDTAAGGVIFDTPEIIAAGESLSASVIYSASGPEPGQGKLTLLSNDPAQPDGTPVNLFANVSGPCINVVPSWVDFGAKLVGSQATIDVVIESCGDEALEISDIGLQDDPYALFSVGGPADGAFPLVIAQNDSITVPVTYVPDRVAELRPDGSVVPDTALVRIMSNAYLAQVDILVQGHGTETGCPDPVITVAEGAEVIPQTVLHLSAEDSVAAGSPIARYDWTVEAPAGSASIFFPSPFVKAPSYEANIVGEYIFQLTVSDAGGNPSCRKAQYIVNVNSDNAIHVELLWTTPGDLDETDTGDLGGNSVGSDMDLHFVHPLASGCDNDMDGVADGYFDPLYDVYFGNPTPSWAGADASDDPRLDRDDKDGAGPENLNLDFPEPQTRYKIGAHYWNDWGYGSSIATVRVFIYGAPSFEWSGVQLVHQDMWTVGELAWPAGTVTRTELPGGLPDIESSYSYAPGLCPPP